jgi:hypothetical protein
VSHWFDNAAVEAAGEGPGVTRREGLRRAMAVMLVGGPVAALANAGFPRSANAASEECTRCLNFASQAYASGYVTCGKAAVKGHAVGGLGSIFTLFCVEANIATYQVTLVRCFTGPCSAPPPERGDRCPPPPSCSQVPAPPPSIPQGDTQECLNCLSVGGKCCYAGAGSLCACANPSLDCCQRYGCC